MLLTFNKNYNKLSKIIKFWQIIQQIIIRMNYYSTNNRI